MYVALIIYVFCPIAYNYLKVPYWEKENTYNS